MSATVTFRTGTIKPDMTRDEVITWTLGTITADQGLRGFQAMAVSATVTSMVKTIQAAHDTGKCVAVKVGGRDAYEITCTRTGGILARRYAFHVTAV